MCSTLLKLLVHRVVRLEVWDGKGVGGQFALDTGYLTIEDGVWRLINIINYITFLSRQARPLTVNYHVWLYM